MTHLRRGLACVIVLLLALPLSEALCRLFYTPRYQHVPPPTAVYPYSDNPYILRARPFLHFHIPGCRYLQDYGDLRVEYAINSFGFRGPEVAAQPTPGMQRLLMMGDSVVEGAGCEYADTFTARLNAELATRNWEAVGAAIQGASPVYYACNLPRLLALHPHLVLITISQDDFRGDYEHEHKYEEADAMDDAGYLILGREEYRRRTWWPRHWRLTGVIRRWMASSDVQREPTAVEQLIASNLAAREGTPLRFVAMNQTNPARVEQTWRLTQVYLDYVVDQLTARGVTTCAATLHLFPLTSADPAFAEHARLVDEHAVTWARDRGVPCFDLTAALRASAGGAEPLLLPDGHLTSAGHRVVADALSSHLGPQLTADRGSPTIHAP